MTDFICPICRLGLRRLGGGLACDSGLHEFQNVSGVPHLSVRGTHTGHDELGHGDAHTTGQAAFFDRQVAAEFETTRPRGTPSFYRFLLDQKFQRALGVGKDPTKRHTALVVCGGSGMDAEYVARGGFRVTSSDISAGAAERLLERSRRFGLRVEAVVADIEALPFPDRSFDLVLVHDGLHHLEDPMGGLAEMVRVARRWVSVTEPANAAATRVATRLGLAQVREESGNVVARLELRDVVEYLGRSGFAITRAERYAMYYKHAPGRVMAALSGARTLPVAVALWRVGNALVGPIGNKLVVVGERRS